jgi:hypothetical protein
VPEAIAIAAFALVGILAMVGMPIWFATKAAK